MDEPLVNKMDAAAQAQEISRCTMQRWSKLMMIPSVAGIISLILVVSLTCAGKLMPQPRHEMLSVMGRPTYVYKPRQAADGPRAAIFVLHGSMAVAQSMFNVGFEDFADRHNFLVVYPEMQVPRALTWALHDDIPYFAALSKRLQADDFGLDASRAYVCGHSAGGTMSLFLQNEAEDIFSGAAAVEAAVGQLQHWNMSRTGRKTMIVWNHADPVLAAYAPNHNETEYYDLNVEVLRRHGSRTPSSSLDLPTSWRTLNAKLVKYDRDAAPELVMVSWRSAPGTHSWPKAEEFSFDAANLIMKFFLQVSESQPLLVYI
eukprot:TRINITY_DN5195_c0_g1_i1.p1 TRINITY_DN5195_c0_g1~~TRINITY_DN5195_c0_g1_i1.p1  ORF type:complete len:316 (+),score=61.43 TRINITY_DN5195_c0_g1_i1:81-1028(+)